MLMQVFMEYCISPGNMFLKPLRVQFESQYALSEVSNIKQSLLSLSKFTSLERHSPSPRAVTACNT